MEADATSKLVPTFQAGRWIISVGFFFVVIMVEVYSAWVGGKFWKKRQMLSGFYEIVSMKTSYISWLGISEKSEGYHVHCTANPKIKNWLIIIYRNPT